jgi:hypothetical protein
MSKIATWLMALLLLMGIGFHGYRIAIGKTVSDAEVYLITIILTALSWLVSESLSKSKERNQAESNAANKIDAIAQQSSKKLADQSTNIFELEQFVEQVLLQKNEIGEKLDQTDLYALIQILRTLRRTNTGLMEDWNGVASDKLSETIRVMAMGQQAMFAHIARPNWQPDDREEIDKINEIAKSLPTSALPTGRFIEFRQPVVGAVQQIRDPSSDEKRATGTITVETMRPAYKFTFAGKFDPKLNDVPAAVVAELVDAPSGTTAELRVRAGTGTVFDFAVHLKSDEYGVQLPAGKYTIKYSTKPA